MKGRASSGAGKPAAGRALDGAQPVRLRRAGLQDAAAIAKLHAESWRRHYRGAYSDSFLDREVWAERLDAWSARLRDGDAKACTVVAERRVDERPCVVGFAHVVFDEDPRWGALLDNMHVCHSCKRSGIGTRLMALTARKLLARRACGGLYLWVLEQNRAAQAFYEARGGLRVERAPVGPPGGMPTRLQGSPWKLRYAWGDPSTLL